MSVRMLYLFNPIVVNLYTGYYKKGTLIMKRRHIMCRYLKTWFIVDFIASFPYTWIIDFDSFYDEDGNITRVDYVAHHTSQLLRLLKIIRFVRLIRLIRLLKLRRLVNKVRIAGLSVLFVVRRSIL